MFENCRNSKQQGDVGLSQAIAWFSQQGFTVCLPLTDSQEYDLVVEKNGTLSRVQVKTTRYKTPTGVYRAALKVCGGNQSEYWSKNFDPTSAEFLFVLTEEGTKYVIPSSEVQAVTQITLGSRYEKFRCSM